MFTYKRVIALTTNLLFVLISILMPIVPVYAETETATFYYSSEENGSSHIGENREVESVFEPQMALTSEFESSNLVVPPTIPLLAPDNPVLDPISNTHQVPLTTTISITYDEPISSTTVNTRTFAVHALQTGLLTQTYTVNNGTISLTPNQALKPGELVQVSATTGTLNLSGQGPILPTVWQFRGEVTQGSGILKDSGQGLGNSRSVSVSLGDLDGDGDLDAFVVNENVNDQFFNKIWINQGNGTFTESPYILNDNLPKFDAALGDVDGDGDLDVFVTSVGIASYPHRLWLNNGKGQFTESQQFIGCHAIIDMGDLDGDGDLDAFLTCRSGGNYVLLNNGQGTFFDSGQDLGDESNYSIVLGDVDSDGDLDAYVDSDKLWINNGHSVFTKTQVSTGTLGSRADLGDLDNDGDLDVVTTNEVLFNNGQGVFTNSGQILDGMTSNWDHNLGDLDGDGDLDAIERGRIWFNDGQGQFSDSGQVIGSFVNNYPTRDIALGDLDGDGDLDAFIVNESANQVWLNQSPLVLNKSGTTITDDGLITYTLTISNIGYSPITNTVVTDVIPTNAVYITGGTKINQVVQWIIPSLAPQTSEQVSFVVTTTMPLITNSTYYATADQNISAIGEQEVLTLVNPFRVTKTIPLSNGLTLARDGLISFTFNSMIDGSTLNTGTMPIWGSQTGFYTQLYTLTGQSILFDAQPNYKPGEEITIHPNRQLQNLSGQRLIPFVRQFRVGVAGGRGLFRNSGPYAGSFDNAAVLGDLNGDGILDTVSDREITGGGTQAILSVVLSDGPSNYSVLYLGSYTFATIRALALGDLDQDGDLDIFVGHANGHANKVWFNNGGIQGGTLGTFTDSGQGLGSSSTYSVALGDIDGDGDLDAFSGNIFSEQSRLWLNNGSGYFYDSDQQLDSAWSIRLGDLDSDGDLDAFSGYSTSSKVWFNEGGTQGGILGNFSDSGQILSNSGVRDIALGDLDNDGDLDTFIASGDGDRPNEVWFNNGSGFFQKSTQSAGSSDNWGVALGDIDGDGDLDAFLATRSNPNKTAPNEVRLNNGKGEFYDSGQRLGDRDSRVVVFGDSDGDGDLDAYVDGRIWINQNLQISKTAPSIFSQGGLITYTLTVTNVDSIPMTNLLITDTIPDNATYITGGTKIGNVVNWTHPSLAPNNSISVQFAVTATQTITNSDYHVSADGGYSATGQDIVVTTIAVPDSVQVIDENIQPISGTLIFHNGQFTGTTNSQGILTFTRPLSLNDTLAALQMVYEQPTTRTVHSPDGGNDFAFRVYRTTLPVENSGMVSPYTVTDLNRRHTLNVTPTNTLILFNLVISIEWDADDVFVTELEDAFQLASNMLYDATDGQMALGWITIYDKAEQWEQADIQILAHNRARPNAFVGGINTLTPEQISYKGFTPGYGPIILGRYWDGYSANIGSWNKLNGYATIIHEFAHYALFLFDEYFYYEEFPDYRLRLPSRCSVDYDDPASIMTNQYVDTEFCNRIAHYALQTRQIQFYEALGAPGETSWRTIKGIYSDTLQSGGTVAPWTIQSPLDRGVEFVLGPSQLPLGFPLIQDLTNQTAAFTKKVTIRYDGLPVDAIVALDHGGSQIFQGLNDSQGMIEVLGVSIGDNICARTIDIGLNNTLDGCLNNIQDANDADLHLSACMPGVNCAEIGGGHGRAWTGGPGDEFNLATSDGNFSANASAGAFSTQITITVGTTSVVSASLPAGLTPVALAYTLESENGVGSSGITAQDQSITQTLKPMALNFSYHDLDKIDESTVKPYYFDGTQWVEVTRHSVDNEANQVSASSNRLGTYMIMAKPLSTNIHLPIIIKNN